MLTAYLAGSGGQVLIPDAVDVLPGETPDEVHFVDVNGKVLVTFKRADVALYSQDGPHAGAVPEQRTIP
jgi:hypothetical protein